jgi:hypothetical protein
LTVPSRSSSSRRVSGTRVAPELPQERDDAVAGALTKDDEQRTQPAGALARDALAALEPR